MPVDADEDEAYVSGASGQSAQHAIHVATRRPGKRRAVAAAAVSDADVDGAAASEELQQRSVIS